MRLPQDRILHIGTELAGDEVRVIAEGQGELVRCKDCKHRQYHEGLNRYYCEMYYGQGDVSDENYCQWGERREP